MAPTSHWQGNPISSTFKTWLGSDHFPPCLCSCSVQGLTCFAFCYPTPSSHSRPAPKLKAKWAHFILCAGPLGGHSSHSEMGHGLDGIRPHPGGQDSTFWPRAQDSLPSLPTLPTRLPPTPADVFIFLGSKISVEGDCAAAAAAAAAKSLQSCLTLCDPMDGSLRGSPVPGILQARTLEWVAISFSNAWKWKVKVKSLSHVWLSATPWTAAYQAPPSMGFSRQEYWNGVPLPSPGKWL